LQSKIGNQKSAIYSVSVPFEDGTPRCRGSTVTACRERYVSLALLGRNMHTLGRILIAEQAPNSEAAMTRRKAAA